MKFQESVMVPALALLLAFGCGAVLIAGLGRSPLEVYGELLRGTLGNPYGVGQVLFKATPLILTGLACALGFRAGLFNIGAEGQMQVGAFGAAWAGFAFTGTPAWLHVPLCLLAAALAGGIWGAVPGVLKARFGSHEVINTIMLNFVALALTSYGVSHVFVVPQTLHTPEIAPTAVVFRLDQFLPSLSGSPVNATLFLALGACAWYGWFLWSTRAGFELRAAGWNASAAANAGIASGPVVVGALALSGALAGLAGTNFVLGYKHYFESGFSSGIGFMGLAVALLGRSHPVGVILAGLLFGLLSQGGLVINTLVPKELVEVLQGLVILSVVVSGQLWKEWSGRRRPDVP